VAVKIRLARHGAKKHPYYRVVVADSRMPRDGRYIELIGRYNPLTNPKTIDIDLEKVDAWIEKGAQPTSSAAARTTIISSIRAALLIRSTGSASTSSTSTSYSFHRGTIGTSSSTARCSKSIARTQSMIKTRLSKCIFTIRTTSCRI